MIAIGLAIAAVLCALAAVIVVLMRDGDSASSTPAAATVTVIDHRVAATDLVKIPAATDVVTETVSEDRVAKGVRITDVELATALGLEADDVITALSGRPVTSSPELSNSVRSTSRVRASTVYVEIVRRGEPVLLRWQIDGDLRAAIRANTTSADPFAASSAPLGGIGLAAPSPPDPLIDSVTRVDDTHFKVPRATLDAWLANPTQYARGARVVPAIKNGKPDGFKLYAIRPSSPYSAIGLHNGDTIHAINNFVLDSPEDALDAYMGLRTATTLTLDVTRRGRPVVLSIEITK